MACENFKMFAALNMNSLLATFADSFGNFMKIPRDFEKIVLKTFDQCVFDPTNDTTISNSFKFLLFKP